MGDLGTLDLGPQPWIVGHRGAAGSALENTVAAVRAGADEGAVMLEIDVQLTSDLVPVVFHDWDLRRLVGRGDIVERTTLDSLREVDTGSSATDPPATIPLLSEILDAVPTSVAFNLEIKCRFHDSGDFGEMLRGLSDSDRPVIVSSFDWRLLARLRHDFPDLPLAPIGRFKAEALLRVADDIEAASVHVHRELAPTLLDGTPEPKLPVLVYTVNDAQEARNLIDQGAAGIFTDHPGRLRAALADDD